MTKQKHHSALLLLLTVCHGLCLAVHAAEEPTGILTLAQALALAEERYPELNSARLDVHAAECRVTRASTRQNPTLSFEAENFGGKDEQKGFDTAEYTAQLEQTMELGGKRGKRIRVAQSEQKLSTLDMQRTRLDGRAETARRFISLLGAQEQVALGRESLVLAEELVQAVAARVCAGKGSPMDEDKARILLAQEKAALETAQGQHEVARVQLAAMWGSASPRFDRAAGDLQTVPPVPDLPGLVVRLAANPDLARWAAAVEQCRAVLARERAARLPDVTLAGGVRRSAETDSQAFLASLSIPLPVFDSNQGNVHEAKLILEKVEQQSRTAETAAAAALTEAHQTLSTALNRITTLKNEVIPRSKAVFDAVQTGYAEGKFGYLEVLDARRTFFGARGEYGQALVSGQKAMIDVERIVGGALSVPGKN
ncbi:MAG: TolC family protein [bacterium]